MDEGGDITDFDFKADSHNITEVMTAIKDWVNKADGYEKTYEYEHIMKNGDKGQGEIDGISLAIRLLIHYVGDVHQPLHASARVDKKYPKGDAGGNAFGLPNHYGAKNLHSVWDKVIYQFHKSIKLPFTEDTWASLSDDCDKIRKTHTVTKEKAEELDFKKWAAESFDIVERFVYKGIKEDEKLPQTYLDKATDIAET